MLEDLKNFASPIEKGDVRYVSPRDVEELGLPQGSRLAVMKDVRTRFARTLKLVILKPDGEIEKRNISKSRFLELGRNRRSPSGSAELGMDRACAVNHAVRGVLEGGSNDLQIRADDSREFLDELAGASDRVYVRMEEEGFAYLQGERVRRLTDGQDDGSPIMLKRNTNPTEEEMATRQDRQRYNRMSRQYPAWFNAPGLPEALDRLYKTARPQSEEEAV